LIIGEQFVFIHSPKTGGTFVTKMLKNVSAKSPGFSIMDLTGMKHASAARIPEEHKHKLLVTNIRNPLDHYVSRYCYRWWAIPKHAKKRFHMQAVLNDFPSFPNITFPEFLKLFNMHRYRRFSNDNGNRGDALEEKRIGFNTLNFLRMIRGKTSIRPRDVDELVALPQSELKEKFSNVRMLRTNSLNGDLAEFLADLGIKEDVVQHVREHDRVMPVGKGRAANDDWRGYYTREDMDHVLEWDRLIFRLFPDMIP
jgi:hypothetical protein